MEKTNPISDNSSLSISLPMIIQAVTFIVMLVWGYSQLNARISFLEYQVAMNEEHIIDLEEDAEKNQDAEIPADIKQNQRIEYLEREVERLRDQ
jgi:biopolymer transport protein ExbB/TolQ|tara:strand:+ start:3492 stop:3773 length:282 start_codon:yes stop_codon:yes gene_type:complete